MLMLNKRFAAFDTTNWFFWSVFSLEATFLDPWTRSEEEHLFIFYKSSSSS